MAMERSYRYTIDDIYALPDGKRAEIIDGYMYMMAPPNTQHQRYSNRLQTKINNYIDSKKGKCEVFAAPFAVFLNNDKHTYVEPDISVICDKSKLDSRGCNGAPDWVIEIVSPSSRRMDYLVKLMNYEKAGVREYWIVDIEKQRVTVHDFENAEMEEYTLADRVKAGIYEDLYIDFSEIAQNE
jgi:Uma2 family endonuclease